MFIIAGVFISLNSDITAYPQCHRSNEFNRWPADS